VWKGPKEGIVRLAEGLQLPRGTPAHIVIGRAFAFPLERDHMAAKVFFSYSHKDEALRDQLEVQLAMLKREGLVESWHDRRMIAGDRLDWEIDRNLNEADIILLLVSPDFLASDYCYKIEKARALERQQVGEARVISVILRPCDWEHTDLPQFLVTPKDGKPVTQWPDRDEAFLDIVRSIRRAIEDIGKASKPLQTHLWVNEPRGAPKEEGPRSSNLRLRKEFSQADEDDFLHESFEYLARFFENSLEELKARNPQIEARYRRIDANKFTAAIYKAGKKTGSCTIRIGGVGDGITFAHSDDARDNSYNESLTVDKDDQKLFLKPLGMASFGADREQKLSHEGAAEYLWSLFIGHLQ
jgi:TIR domain